MTESEIKDMLFLDLQGVLTNTEPKNMDLVGKWYHEAYKYYKEHSERPFIDVSMLNVYRFRNLIHALTKSVGAFVDLNIFDVSEMKDFYGLLPRGFRGRFDKWNPRRVDDLVGFGYALDEPVDFYNLAVKLTPKTIRTTPPVSVYEDGMTKFDLGQKELSNAYEAMPSMGIHNTRDLKKYVRTYELVQKLLSGEKVKYDDIYNAVPNIKQFLFKSPFITSGVTKLAQDPEFAKKWMRKIIGC